MMYFVILARLILVLSVAGYAAHGPSSPPHGVFAGPLDQWGVVPFMSCVLHWIFSVGIGTAALTAFEWYAAPRLRPVKPLVDQIGLGALKELANIIESAKSEQMKVLNEITTDSSKHATLLDLVNESIRKGAAA